MRGWPKSSNRYEPELPWPPSTSSRPVSSVSSVAERVDGVGLQRGRKRRRVGVPAVAVEVRACGCVGAVDGARAGIDDQLLARAPIGDRGVAPRVTGRVAVLAVELRELVPGGLLVRQVDAPLDVDERAGIAAAFDRVAELERPPLRAARRRRPRPGSAPPGA